MKFDGNLIEHTACPKCQENGDDSAGDNLAVYDNGSKHCFACLYHVHGDGKETVASEEPVEQGYLSGYFAAIPDRGITEETCKRFNYQVGRHNGQDIHIANFIRKNKVVGQKIRYPGKNFRAINMKKASAPPLFGQHIWSGKSKKLLITEGEIDALSASQMLDTRWWSVVSLPNGAASAPNDFKNNLEFINQFEEVFICFDNDKEGNNAAKICAELVPAGKARVVHLVRKDANEYLLARESTKFSDLCWQAESFRPDGIVHVREIDLSSADIGKITEYPWESLTRSLLGRRSGELVMHTSGSGMGKSTVLREMQLYDINDGHTVGVLALEESCKDTLHDLMSLYLNKPVKRILAARQINAARLSQGKDALHFNVVDDLCDDEYREAVEWFGKQNLYMYDHFGSVDSDNLLNKLEYMVTGLGCTQIYLDHISIVVSGMDSGNERKDIDILMTNLRTFVERTDCHLDAVCHLCKPDGRPFEEGGQISLRDLRGSGSLYQFSDGVLGYERNQQADDESIKNTVRVRSLKDRFGGHTAIVGALRYNSGTSRLDELDFEFDEAGNILYIEKGMYKTYDQMDGRDLTDIVTEETPFDRSTTGASNQYEGTTKVRL